jgi:hypothetical protein
MRVMAAQAGFFDRRGAAVVGSGGGDAASRANRASRSLAVRTASAPRRASEIAFHSGFLSSVAMLSIRRSNCFITAPAGGAVAAPSQIAAPMVSLQSSLLAGAKPLLGIPDFEPLLKRRRAGLRKRTKLKIGGQAKTSSRAGFFARSRSTR